MKNYPIVLIFILSFSLSQAGEIKTFNPESVPAPFKDRFSHGKVVPANAEWLFTAGQTGRRIDGTVGDGIEEQADLDRGRGGRVADLTAGLEQDLVEAAQDLLRGSTDRRWDRLRTLIVAKDQCANQSRLS